MAPPSPTQLAWRGRIEALIRIAEPALDLVLVAGDRLSRVVEREELDWAPPREMSGSRRRVGAGRPCTEPAGE